MGARKPPGREAWGRVLLDSLEEFRKEDERGEDDTEDAAHQNASLENRGQRPPQEIDFLVDGGFLHANALQKDGSGGTIEEELVLLDGGQGFEFCFEIGFHCVCVVLNSEQCVAGDLVNGDKINDVASAANVGDVLVVAVFRCCPVADGQAVAQGAEHKIECFHFVSSLDFCGRM